MRAFRFASLALIFAGCSPAAPSARAPVPASEAALLPDVRVAKDRPPVALVSREGDPATAIAVAVSSEGAFPEDEEPEAAAAMGGVVEARLGARGIEASVTPSWDGYRVVLLVAGVTDARTATEALRDALTSPVGEKDVAPAKKKLGALAQRPLRDAALARWARCIGSPHAAAERAAKLDDVALAKVEKWRAATNGLGRVALAVAGPRVVGDAVADTIAHAPAWKPGASFSTSSSSSGANASAGASSSHDVYETYDHAQPVVHAVLDLPTSSAAVTTAAALGDGQGPLATRLAELDLPFKLREVDGTAHARGGCVGVVLEAAPSPSSAGSDIAARVADAVALVSLEADVHLSEIGNARDGRALARRSGDAREAAERAAWWMLGDTTKASLPKRLWVALGIPSKKAPPPKTASTPGAPSLEPTREALASAIDRATLAWQKTVVEGRTRVELGQGEAWMLLASPCGTDGETESDAGLTALVAAAAAENARASSERFSGSTADVVVEPWVVPDGAGVLVHGPAQNGEMPAAHARRLADVVARSFAADPIATPAIARARSELLRRDAHGDGPAMAVLGAALAPQHPSWIVAWGSTEPLARSADSAVVLRAQSLRAGPLRLAVLANVDATQADAAVRAADRWVPRRAEGTRTCRAPTATLPPKPGTYAIEPKSGAVPEAYLAFPFAAGDDAARAAAATVVASLEGSDGLLDKAVLATSLAREASARVVGVPRAPALVIRIVSSQASLDAAVMQTRALLDRIHKGGLVQNELDRAQALVTRSSLMVSLDPRARIVATWRGEAIATTSTARPRVTAEDVRAFAQKSLAEDAMVVVAVRPGRQKP